MISSVTLRAGQMQREVRKDFKSNRFAGLINPQDSRKFPWATLQLHTSTTPGK